MTFFTYQADRKYSHDSSHDLEMTVSTDPATSQCCFSRRNAAPCWLTWDTPPPAPCSPPGPVPSHPVLPGGLSPSSPASLWQGGSFESPCVRRWGRETLWEEGCCRAQSTTADPAPRGSCCGPGSSSPGGIRTRSKLADEA